ncbi:hypothetical protein EW146_g2294 [Bondarzewia mesenterica]|uniref:Uncharacterized protein n=1 Tax=Bondarzewia mesenterica TaxID=1095465 RepID=A0A4S4M1L3_9AGAM|nr:hypothetical protein EW146_g2294 [Bondarzewia mesenterica]
MCNLETEGTKYGCGHYVITKKLRKIDCNNRYCIWSSSTREPAPLATARSSSAPTPKRPSPHAAISTVPTATTGTEVPASVGASPRAHSTHVIFPVSAIRF